MEIIKRNNQNLVKFLHQLMLLQLHLINNKHQEKVCYELMRSTHTKIYFLFIGNATTLNKKQPAAIRSEVKRTPTVEGEGDSDQEDEGQWVTQSNKQVCL